MIALKEASVSPSAALALPGLSERLDQFEAFGDQTSRAIEGLVDAVLGLRDQAAVRHDADELLSRLFQQLQALDQQWQLDRACRDLERTSRFHPKERSVVFVGTSYFGCNVKYAWLAFRECARREGVQTWFLPQTAQQEAAVCSLGEACLPLKPGAWTAQHLHAALSAAVVVTCDHLLNPNPYAAALLAGARHVQLWHGVSIKEIGLRNLPGLARMSPHAARVLATCGPFTHFIGTSASQEGDFRRWFGFGRYAALGYPRNDVLLREPDAGDLLNVDMTVLDAARRARGQGTRVVLYAPTFRDAQPGAWIIEAGLEAMAREVDRRGDMLIVNMHPVEAPLIPQLQRAVPSARFVTPRTDIYPLLREASVLVTDYSSVMFDFLLLDRPVVLYRPDHAAYVARSRPLLEAKLEPLPGPLCTSLEGLLAVLRQDDFRAATHADARHALRSALFDHVDGLAGERCNALLLQELRCALPSLQGGGSA